ncbi:MAG: hypothetical protein K0U64_09510, partial [Actinomycetia bacterium]|nr:hypothetical protein [Actinomycetes bacterium]
VSAIGIVLVVSGVAWPALGDLKNPNAPSNAAHGSVTVIADWAPPSQDAAPAGGRPGGEQRCAFQGADVPCFRPGSSWSPSRQCYVSLRDPQPPKSDPVWQGNRTGQIFDCLSPMVPLRHLPPFWAAQPPAAGPPPIELAESATDSMQLQPFRIGITPPAGSTGLVALPTWLWVDAPADNQWASRSEPKTVTATAGPVSVTARAYVAKTVWDMGDGTSVTCTGPGQRYRKRDGAQPSPSCGHVYYEASDRRLGQAYSVSARSYWVVDWAETGIGNGQSGQFRFELESTTQVRIGELQLLVRR